MECISNVKSMGNRVTQNPWPRLVHFWLAVFGLDVLPVPWPQPMLVKITIKGDDLRPIPSFGFCQGLKAEATQDMKLYLDSWQQTKHGRSVKIRLMGKSSGVLPQQAMIL